tara:strand:+ start:74 stop:439 length:366 start_codon:yes stop_codon:yes gene_type:complete
MEIPLEIEINTKDIIPSQGLAGKKVEVSRIQEIAGYINGKNMHSVCAEQAEKVGMTLGNLTSWGQFYLELPQEEFRRVLDAYGSKYPEDLVGRCGLALYEETPTHEISGFIPLASSRRKIE